ncbi:uncharacterized protein ACA1_338960 [Acanthamoeba castellanii str. Neff]|uniref:Uncharacterized protein n=1 Tax=Acanthamoeba castellanii (strain ATCC 30010 / Neff) TaxID=1257118 RepID=L8H7D3_ACACF|nr:uncharacterized protein ACA1_338960 [Acanthamoeba castellanii str. Neff]ELR20396.1 hypothetical protein ACA1_338960 [Acanthamoeba castellanii str. Neff]
MWIKRQDKQQQQKVAVNNKRRSKAASHGRVQHTLPMLMSNLSSSWWKARSRDFKRARSWPATRRGLTVRICSIRSSFHRLPRIVPHCMGVTTHLAIASTSMPLVNLTPRGM